MRKFSPNKSAIMMRTDLNLIENESSSDHPQPCHKEGREDLKHSQDQHTVMYGRVFLVPCIK